MDGIDKKNRIHFCQRSVLPFFYFRQKTICDIRNHAFADFKTINIFNHLRNLACCHAFGIHRNDLIIDCRDVFLTFLDDFKFKCTVAVLRNTQCGFAIFTANLFLFISISGIGIFRAFIGLITQVFIHFSFHHFFDGIAQQIFESVLDILCWLDIVFLQKCCNNVFLTLGHSFSSCHNLRPPHDIFILS